MLAQVLKEKRLAAGLSQSDVAKALGYTSAQFLSNQERGLSRPSVKSLKALAKLYKCPELPDLVLESMVMEYQKKLAKKFKGA